jgi:hypothetical protein
VEDIVAVAVVEEDGEEEEGAKDVGGVKDVGVEGAKDQDVEGVKDAEGAKDVGVGEEGVTGKDEVEEEGSQQTNYTTIVNSSIHNFFKESHLCVDT